MEGEGGEKNEQLVYGPADVAARLGVSPAGLRRLAVVYERVYGELRRDPRLGRMWPQEAVERLERARNMVNTGQAVSVESALTSLASDDPSADDPRAQALARPRSAAEQEDRGLKAVVGELRALRQAIEEQNRRLHALEEENRQLRVALPPPREEQPSPRWGRAVRLSQPLRWLTSRVARDAASRGTPSGGLWARSRSLLARTVRRGR